MGFVGTATSAAIGWLKHAAAAGSTLLNGLVSYWPLDEVSGTRSDAVGSNDLTDNNTVGSVNSGPAGVVAAPVLANSEYFSLADSATTVWGEDGNGVTFAGWVKITEPAGSGNGAMLLGPSTGNRKFEIWSNATGDKFSAQTYVPADFDARAESLAVATGVWHFVVGWFSPVDKKTHVQVDLATVVDSSGTCASGTLPAASGATWFGLSPYGANDKMGGAWGRWGVWNRVLTSDERTSLFNGGIGKSYADLTAAEKVDLVSYWNLDEVSGTRADSHGSNDLTDNNTVGSVINAGGAMHNAAASFVPVNAEYLSLADGLESDIKTVSLWVYTNSIASTEFPLQFTDDSGHLVFHLQIYGGSFHFYAEGLTPGIVVGSLGAGGWHHVIAEMNNTSSTMSLWVDSVAQGGSPVLNTGSPYTATKLTISGNRSSYYWDGLIDEVAIWSRVLSEAERTELYNAGAGKFYNGSDFVE